MADTWTVTGQRESSRMTPGGQFEKGMEVYFATVEGVKGSVWLPAYRYNADNVRSAVEDYVVHIANVSQL